MFSFLNNIPTVTRNLLILNVLLFILTGFFQTQHIDLGGLLGAHYIGTPLFEPYQIVSHFFMHAGILHIFFNMFGLVMLGGFLERIWGPKRFFVFYICCALGAFALYNAIGIYKLNHVKEIMSAYGIDPNSYYSVIKGYTSEYTSSRIPELKMAIEEYLALNIIPMVGASGAIFGILTAFAILFPNTEFLLYFAIPVKAKFLVIGYLAYEIYNVVYPQSNDNVAHLAHIGGAIVGAIFVLVWRKSRTNFY